MNISKHYNDIFKKIISDMGDQETTNIQLDEYGKKILKRFKGSFPRDKKPHMKNGDTCILNLDTSDKGGTHWVGLVLHNNKYYMYDSFGRNSNILKNHGKGMKTTERDAEQDYDEYNCGQRSLSALYIYEKYGILEYIKI
jgi:hypothetical protein